MNKKSTHRHGYIVSLLVTLMLFTWFNHAYGWGVYPETAFRLKEESKDILVRYDVCKDNNDCTIKEYIFFDGDNKNAMIIMHKVYNMAAIEEIASACMKEYHRSGQSITIELLVYSKGREEVYGMLGLSSVFIKPFVYLKLEGKK